MITFGNEVKNANDQNSNKNSINKKPNDIEKLQLKYRKLEKENKRLKNIIEEMITISKNLQNSFEKTENFYLIINKSLKEAKNEDLNKDNYSFIEEKTFKSSLENFTSNLIIDNFSYDIISSSSKFLNEFIPNVGQVNKTGHSQSQVNINSQNQNINQNQMPSNVIINT
jgi:hypothetical protein